MFKVFETWNVIDGQFCTIERQVFESNNPETCLSWIHNHKRKDVKYKIKEDTHNVDVQIN